MTTDEAYRKGYEDGQKSIERAYAEGMSKELYEKLKEEGRNEAWECAKTILNMSKPQLEEAGFPVNNNQKTPVSRRKAILEFTASEAVNKIKAWKEIKVGDEVKLIEEWNDDTALTWVVTRITGDRVEGICPDGAAYDYLKIGELRKTGKHCDYIQRVLEWMNL